jgi:NTP pyrophosphatase (non-canonical NTP hydrolase)
MYTLGESIKNEEDRIIFKKAVGRLLEGDFIFCWKNLCILMDNRGLGNNADVWWLTAQYLYDRNGADNVQVQRKIHECLTEYPHHPLALSLMADINRDLGNLGAAYEDYCKAMQYWPSGIDARLIHPKQKLFNLICKYKADNLKELQEDVRSFTEERDWDQFHNGKDLAMALSIEASELQEAFLWKDAADVRIEKVKEELADVVNYALLIADKYNLNIADIVREKMKKNAEKYPVDKAKGTAAKYSEL